MVTYDNLKGCLLASGPLRRTVAPFGVVKVEGRDAPDFLQRLCSQDVLSLAAGTCAPAAFLDAKGKLQVTCIVGRTEAAFWLEVQLEQIDRLLQLLDRFHFTERLTFTRMPWTCADWLGADWPAAGLRDAQVMAGAESVAFAVARRGVRWLRVHGLAPSLPAGCDGRPATNDEVEALRMLAGFVRVGVETEPTTLALEADLDDHCSSTKGCYTGQEIGARIHTYGHVNRRLCLLQLADGAPITAPVPVHEPEDDVPVGRVMHAVRLPALSLRLGLGYLPRDFQAPGTQLRLADGTTVSVLR